MAVSDVLLFSALVLLCCRNCGQMLVDGLNQESEDFSDWRDPTDMINYDLATGKMRNTEVVYFRLNRVYYNDIVLFWGDCFSLD